MCGIVGIWNTREPVEDCVFDTMVDSLSHRGPDGRGVRRFDNGRLFLGHRRLSIIDLSVAGQQPMSNEDGTIWMTFNGEIYNFARLRQDLERYGHQFRSRTDSETIIHAYEEWGAECVRHLRGIFAFAIYDVNQKSIFIARDHVGVKPLYYYYDRNTFIFASQPRAILASKGFRRQIDYEAFSLFLAYGNTPSDSCIYKGIIKLLPGHYLIHNDGRLTIQKYWSVVYQPVIRDETDAEGAVRSKIEECVRIQTVSDVPVGSLLSGGIDSTIITSIIAKHLDEDVSSYTVGFEEKESDEREYAHFVADRLHTRQHVKVLTCADACRMIPDITEAFDEPFHMNGLFPYYSLSRLVESSGGKVVLGGDGADELFAGYLWYQRFSDAQSRSAVRPTLQKIMSCLGMDASLNKRSSVETFFYYNGYFDHESQKAFLGADIGLPNSELLYPLRKHWRDDVPPVLAGQLLDFNCFLVDHCLTKVDRSSMACGVEVRVPF
ncbi:MAG: asparagine synthase (glutamine-hydrolyzing) [Saprospiraceae bacterium]|nr:asparagine synthase (glutamine-hydrolyzing) [Candidatus Brachybacter algidus]